VSADVQLTSNVRPFQELILGLASGLRTAVYYDASNAVMQQVCAGLHSLISGLFGEEGELKVAVQSHTVYVNTERVPASVSTYRRFAYLMEQFESWSITGLVFRNGVTSVELMTALGILGKTQQCREEDLAEILRQGGVERVTVDYTVTGRGSRSTEITPIVAYTAAMQLGATLNETGGSLEKGMVRRCRHVTQAVVDQILRDPESLLALTTIKDFDRYLILHSTNVAVLATLLGQRLGLEKARLGELCLAGFLHDAGKLGVDPDVLNKPGALDKREWQEMRRHPVLATYSLLGNQRLTSSNMRAAVVAFEHHLNYDLSGYPPVEIKTSVSLFGNIVCIADCFDALTTARVYRKVNPTPPEAIAHLVKHKGTQFDATLVKLFVEVMGVYPPGTVLALTGHEAGVVCRAPAVGAALDRPKVRIVVGGEPGRVVDLSERRNGGYVRSAVAVLNPGNKGQIPAVDPATLASAN
jgi:HD-GYP domain-containing protein (c-di-GMP phosphodiesterase class II)